MQHSVTPTIADHSTHCLFTAERCTSPRRSLIECYHFSAMSQTVLQAPTTAAAASAAACLAAKETVSLRLASSLRSYDCV